MMATAKIKESRKHKRREKKTGCHNVLETTSNENISKRPELTTDIAESSCPEVKEPDKDRYCERNIEKLEYAEKEYCQTEEGNSDCCQNVPQPDKDVLDVSNMLDKLNVNIDKQKPQELFSSSNFESSTIGIQNYPNCNQADFSVLTPGSEIGSMNYNKVLNELKSEMETCAENAPKQISPFADILCDSENCQRPDHVFQYLHCDAKLVDKEISVEKELNVIKLETVPDPKALTPFSEEELSQYYYNSELKQAQNFIADFIKEEINNEVKVLHPFFVLLSNYLKAKNNLQVSQNKIKDLDEKLDIYLSEMWTVWNDIEINEIGKCVDGNSVAVTKKYTQAKFNQQVFENFTVTLNEIKSNLFETFKIDSFNCLKYKLKIEQYIQSLLTSCSEFSNINESSGISLVQPSTDSYFQQCLSKLRISIGILFLFQRKQKVDMSSSFLQESRQWLTDLIAVLIRTGNLKDHLFILNHILRCPGGVGKWGSHFVQFPKSPVGCDPFSDPVVNHMMAVMSILLQSVEKREDFINEWNTVVPPDENSWVMIDSEDEDDDAMVLSSPLKENDLVLLMNQIPLKDLFSSVLGLSENGLNPCVINESHLMKLFSFTSDFIKVIHSGLQVYSTQRYKQFAKRLGQLLRHVIEYATYELDFFKSNYPGTYDRCVDRLQAEYDNIFLKSAKSIYSSRFHGTWQFLAVIPYHLVSKNAILELYFGLQFSDADAKNFQINLTDFGEKFHQLPESEQFYLLSTFTSMALARDEGTEYDFKKTVVHQLVYIGFICTLTKDECYKSVKSLLCNLCDKHPFLMTEILQLQNVYFEKSETRDQGLSIYLWKDLPIKTWKPSVEVLDVLSSWLLQPLQSVRSELARIIVKSFNYGIDQEELFLPCEIHRKIAHIILKAFTALPQDQEMNVIKNVSTFVGLQEPEQALQTWCWNVLFKLRLHLFDKSLTMIRNSLENLHENLQDIPELLSIKELNELVQQKNPVACFIALMTTSIGHSVPVIFNEGFALLEVLIRARKSEAAIVCMEFMTLMFLECPESLYRCHRFTSILSQLISLDNSYLKLAKNLKPSETPDPIVLSLESMIQNQIRTCYDLCINRTIVIELWAKSLTKIQLWMQEPGIVHLMDLLCRNAFFDKAASCAMKEVLTASLLECSSPSEAKSSLASLVNWMNNKSTIPTLLPRGCNGNAVWFFLKAVEAEQELYENANFLWNELLKELLVKDNKKTNIDGSLKKACSRLQIPARTSEVLTIYRLCYQILETKATHPMMIILWQKFFLLYFQRVPGFVDSGSVGEKFFHGFINQNLFKRLKQRLEEIIDCYSSLRKESSKSNSKFEFYDSCFSVLLVFQLWLEEPKLHEPHLNVHLLPPHYKIELLNTLINQNDSLWMELVDYSQIQNGINKCILAWKELKSRRTKSEIPKSPSLIQNKSLSEKIHDGLSRYETPLPAPSVVVNKYAPLGLAKDILLHSDSIGSYLRPSFKNTLEYADYHCREIGEYVGLSCSLQELAQLWYSTKTSTITLSRTCDGYEKSINGKKIFFKCSGPAVITLSFEESGLDGKNYDLFNQCLRDFNRCLQHSLLPLQQNLGLSVVTLEKAVDDLKAEFLFMRTHSEDEKLVMDLKESGVRLFYQFVEFWSESVTLTPSIANLFESCVDSLGKAFIMGNPSECDNLLNAIYDHPKLIDKLHMNFHPNSSRTHEFIEFYTKVKKCHPKIKVTLLSRFDLTRWLIEKRPRFAERSLLISEVGSGLKSHGPCPADQLNLVELFNTHLQQLLMYDFPEHYGEIMNLLLEASESQTIPVSTWFMFLNAIVPEGIHFDQGKCDGSTFEPGQPLKKLKYNFTQYATHQRLLSLPDVRETILHLGNAFKMDRLKHGLYGLYPKYRHYIEPILIFSGMMSHLYVAETLKLDLGSLSMSITDQMWPLLKELYSPWLVPYWSKQEKSQTAKWIQELTDDKSVLLPWVNSDVSYASYSCSIFVESVKFVLDTLPGVNNILSHVWFFYVTNYAHVQVKDHVLRVMHKNLLILPWCHFYPTLQDIELMVKVVEHFIPMAHSLLGNIFVQIRWRGIVTYYSSQNDFEVLEKLYVCLLHLLVKLPCEPTLRQNNEISVLLTEAKDYSWQLVDSNSYDAVLNWFVMSCDPRIVLMDENSEFYKLDSLILQILRICAGFTESAREFHSTTVTKRLMYVRACNKWLITANSRFKCKDSDLFKSAVIRILNEIESTINFSISESQITEEIATILSEFLNIFKEEDLSSVLEQVTIEWLSMKRNITFVFGLLRSIALSPVQPKIFGNIVEACLNSYFELKENSSWSDVSSKFVMYASGQSGLQKVLISNGNLLTLYAILLKNFNEETNLLEHKIVVSDIFHSLTSARRCESVEPKLLLMTIHVCKISEIVERYDESEAVAILSRLSGHLVSFDNDISNGILSTFGLKKKEAFSNSFKFICLVTSGGIMKLLKTRYASQEDKIDEKTLRNLDRAYSNKQYSSLTQYITFVNEEMKKMESVGDLVNILKCLGLQMFNKNYLK